MDAESARDVMALDDLPEAAPRLVRLGDAEVLLAREGDTVHAVSATCPHAGGPLIEGVRHGARIVCPWHKATFCLRSGAVLEPPAVDALQTYPVRIEAGRIKLSEPASAAGSGMAKPAILPGERRRFVIAGAGAAGAAAAQTLREAGFGGRIVLLDQANRVPYDRTVLSKYFLSGEKGGEKTPLQSQAWWQAHDIERRTGEIAALDARARRVTCADGTDIDYDSALLATGAVPLRPSLPGAELAHVFLLRARADAEALLARAERSTRAVVLGASFIAMEVAASLRERGLEVAVVAKERVPFTRQLGEQVGAGFASLHKDRGVRFVGGREVAGIEPGRVRLADGEALPADLVVIGFGVRPATSFVSGLSLREDGGVSVDASLQAAEGLWAAGDVAAFPLHGDGAPIRVEHWRVAQQHGRVAALAMLGRPARFTAAPMFWTIQYLKRLDYVGHAEGADDLVLHGAPERQDFLAYYVRDGRVAAAAGMGRDRQTAALTEMLGERADISPDELGSDPERVLAAR